MPPGNTAAPPSLLVSDRSGAPVNGVVSLPVLLPGFGSVPLVPSSEMTAVLATWLRPAGAGLATVTAKVAVCVPLPAARIPTVRLQVEPALASGVQTQPTLLTPA